MRELWLLSFLLYAILILIDEFLFHYKRDVPAWERKGHPLDTLSLLLPLLWLWVKPPGQFNLAVFIFLAVVSCLFVTKDEWVHRLKCGVWEQWLHAVIFIMHPVVLMGAWFLWPELHSKGSGPIFPFGYFAMIMATTLFMTYQAVYWNLLQPRAKNTFY